MGVGEVFTASDQDPAIARQSHRTNGGGGLYTKNKRHFPSVLKRPKLTIIGESSTTALQKLLQHQGPSLVKIQNFTAQQKGVLGLQVVRLSIQQFGFADLIVDHIDHTHLVALFGITKSLPVGVHRSLSGQKLPVSRLRIGHRLLYVLTEQLLLLLQAVLGIQDAQSGIFYVVAGRQGIENRNVQTQAPIL